FVSGVQHSGRLGAGDGGAGRPGARAGAGLMAAPVVETIVRDGWRFRSGNREQFDRIWQDVAEGLEYDMGDLGPMPVIVDAGAHVGVASHWFARRYPDALVLAFEANPA